MAIIAKASTFSGSHPVELSDTSDSTSLYSLLNTNATTATFLSSSYAIHEKGDVSAVVVYENLGGSDQLLCKEFYECRSQYGQSTYTYTGWANDVGEPNNGTTGNDLIYLVNSWLNSNFASSKSQIQILDVHFRIDSTGQKRVFIVYDDNATTGNVTYYAKLYSQNQYNITTVDGPETNFQTDITALDAAKTIDHMFSCFDIDPNGDRHIFAIYGTTA